MSKEKKFIISVVIPVYNTEEYLEETIESIIAQTIGFEDNIQLILVNNVTEDNSEEICLRYLEKYPDNVIYHKMEVNDGPCPARNVGMELATGKYINFLDSDDKWEENAYEEACRFFEEHFDDIDIVSCRIRHFDSKDDWHGLDWKFTTGRRKKIINIREKYQFIQLHVGAVIFKREAAMNHRFDDRVRHAEDCKYVTDVLLDKQKYGLLWNAIFYYRSRSSGDSVLQNVQTSYRWYFDTPELVFRYLFELSKERYGCVLRYIQSLVMYELKWRLATPIATTLSAEEIENYKNIITGLLKEIDDEVIFEQKNMAREHKIYALSLKYGMPVKEMYSTLPGGSICFKNIQIYKDYTDCVNVGYVNIVDKVLHIEGRFWMILPETGWRLVAECGDKEYDCEIMYLNETEKRFSLGEQIHEIKGFKVRIPLSSKKPKTVGFKLYYKDSPLNLGLSYAFICKLTDKAKNAYLHLDNYLIKPVGKKTIDIYPYDKKLHKQLERDLCRELKADKKKKILYWRKLISFLKKLRKNRKPIWLFMDWFVIADNNAEFLFKYVMENNKDKDIKPYYVIAKDSKDYARLKSIGPVIKADSFRYRLNFALADKIVSSVTFYNQNNTFYEKTELLQDLFDFDFVYLQHGVTKDNHADTQNKFKKNISLLVASSEREKEAINKGIGGNYVYDDDVVKVTGLARYDMIDVKDPSAAKRILLAPTWRKEGMGAWVESAQTYKYSKAFVNTEFYKFYQSLINDERILSAMREKGYKMALRLHPRTMQQVEDFTIDNDLVYIEKEANSYAEEMKESSLVITDYSSIAFDYAYAYIPVIFCQFDEEEFFANHSYQKGYFDYHKDGFGEVVNDYEHTVEAIVRMINNDCKMDEIYRKRVDDFYAFHDHNNCERIYNEIIKMK